MLKLGVFLFGFLFLMNFAVALDSGYCLTAEVTSISPSSVDADEDFTVGIEISNCGDELPGNIVFEIVRFAEDIEIQESLVVEVGEMSYSNSKRFLTYHMHSAADAVHGEHVFDTKLTYGDESFEIEKEGSFSVMINSKEPDLAISRIYTNPEIIYSGEKIVLTVDVENAGNGEAKDVRVEITDFEIEGVKQKYLGRIEAGENLPARFVFDVKNDGIFTGSLKLNYKFGGEVKVSSFPFSIQVFPEERNKFWIVGAVLVFGFFGFLLLKKYSSKN